MEYEHTNQFLSLRGHMTEFGSTEFGSFGVVYRIYERSTGKSYIGQTTNNLNRRWSRFFGTHKNLKRDKFSMEILKKCTSFEEMDEFEDIFITRFNSLHPNGFNMRTGGAEEFGWTDRLRNIHAKARQDSKYKIEDVNNGIIYESMHEACKATGLSAQSIGRSASENRRVCGFWLFKIIRED